ncbi:MAG: aldo/keto reductase [Ilumatobacteraceae bacterium]
MSSSALDALRPLRLGFGTAPLATQFWGNERDRAVDAVLRAIDAGITWFDTAPLYGAGEAEERLGAALAQRPGASVGVASKVGRTLGADGSVDFDFSAPAIRDQLTTSLRRLGRERVEVAHVHDPEDHLDQAVGEALPALVALRDEGLVGAVSVGTNVPATAARFAGTGLVDVVMLAGRITLLDRSGVVGALDACRAAGVPLIAAAPFNSGVLARLGGESWFDYAPATPDVLARAGAMAAACARAGVELRAAALQHPLRFDGVLGVVAGMANVAEVDDDLALRSAPIPDELWAELDDLAAEAPA